MVMLLVIAGIVSGAPFQQAKTRQSVFIDSDDLQERRSVHAETLNQHLADVHDIGVKQHLADVHDIGVVWHACLADRV